MTEARLRGTARRIGTGDGPLAGGCRLVVGDDAEAHTQDGELELDGARVDVPSGAVVGERTTKAPYSELVDEPGVAAMRLKPGPHVDATLIQRWIRDGDEIEVIAEHVEDRLGDAGYREAAPATPTYRAIAAGPARAVAAWHADRERRLERERRKAMPKPRRTPPWVAIAMALWLAMAVTLAAAFWLAPSTYSWISPSIVFLLGGSAAAIAWGEVRFPNFAGGRTTAAIPLGFVVAAAGGLCMPPLGPISAAILAALALGGVALAAGSTALAARLLRVLSAPITERPEVGRFGVFAGRIYDRTPVSVGGQAAAVGQVTTITGTGSDAEIDITKLGADSTFQVRGSGFELEVDPANLAWTSDVYTSSGKAGKRKHTTYVPLEAEVLLAGTPQVADGRRRLRHTGPESLVLFAATAGEPRAVLQRMLRDRRAVLLGTLLLVTAEVALALVGFRDDW